MVLELQLFLLSRLQSFSSGSTLETRYVPSQLGLACLSSSLSPDEGLHVFVELQKARKCFVLENELHVIYQVTMIAIQCETSCNSLLSETTVLFRLLYLYLTHAKKQYVLLIPQVVPIYAAVSWPNLDWMHYLSLWESLSPDMKRVGELVGVEERFLVRAMRGTVGKKTEKQVLNG